MNTDVERCKMRRTQVTWHGYGDSRRVKGLSGGSGVARKKQGTVKLTWPRHTLE